MHKDHEAKSILTINGGSSSVKFALFDVTSGDSSGPLLRLMHGSLDRIGLPGSTLTFHDDVSGQRFTGPFDAQNHRSAAPLLIDWLEMHANFENIQAIGHRVVHGMHYSEPSRIDETLLAELRRICPYDPDHLPQEIEIIEAFRVRHPGLPQVACFDTAFHAGMPGVAKRLPIPRHFDEEAGIRRYGFHGLSYAYLMEELERIAGAAAARGRVILAHLGNGASLAAVRGGKSIDTTMGFTPAGGLPMGARPGDLDPGVAWYLMSSTGMSPAQFSNLINHECGLLGISGTTSDVRDLLAKQETDPRAAEAIEYFCYQTRKWIGAMAAALGGLDTLVFSGGIGENSPEIRAQICDGLQFFGIGSSRVAVLVIRTDEEQMIARHTCRLLKSKLEQHA